MVVMFQMPISTNSRSRPCSRTCRCAKMMLQGCLSKLDLIFSSILLFMSSFQTDSTGLLVGGSTLWCVLIFCQKKWVNSATSFLSLTSYFCWWSFATFSWDLKWIFYILVVILIFLTWYCCPCFDFMLVLFTGDISIWKFDEVNTYMIKKIPADGMFSSHSP